MTAPLRVALLHHGPVADGGPAWTLAGALAASGHEVALVTADARRPGAPPGVTLVRQLSLPDAPLRLRKIGDRPGRMPGTLLALARGGYELAHAFTAQDAVVAVTWSRLTGRPAVFSVCEPLSRATLAHRRLRLAHLRIAVERSAAVVAPDDATAESVRRWMAVAPRVAAPSSAEANLAVYRDVWRR